MDLLALPASALERVAAHLTRQARHDLRFALCGQPCQGGDQPAIDALRCALVPTGLDIGLGDPEVWALRTRLEYAPISTRTRERVARLDVAGCRPQAVAWLLGAQPWPSLRSVTFTEEIIVEDVAVLTHLCDHAPQLHSLSMFCWPGDPWNAEGEPKAADDDACSILAALESVAAACSLHTLTLELQFIALSASALASLAALTGGAPW